MHLIIGGFADNAVRGVRSKAFGGRPFDTNIEHMCDHHTVSEVKAAVLRATSMAPAVNRPTGYLSSVPLIQGVPPVSLFVSRLCFVCVANLPTRTFYPCAHMCGCTQCIAEAAQRDRIPGDTDQLCPFCVRDPLPISSPESLATEK
jgi:hypothetical protein